MTYTIGAITVSSGEFSRPCSKKVRQLNTKKSITQIRGEFYDFQGIKLIPTFNPAYLLRDPTKKREVWEDMKKVRDYLKSEPSA